MQLWSGWCWKKKTSDSHISKEQREKNALKAKLRRLCEDKAKHGEEPKLQVPKWLHDEWKSRDHLEMAMEFRDCGFDKDV